MQELMLSMIGEYGNIAVFLLILIENIFPPIPSEVILTFSGFMTTITSMTAPAAVFASTCGSVLGALILYGAGYLIPEELLNKIFDGKIGKTLHFKSRDIAKAKEWFNKKGKITVFLCRLVPVIRSLISIPAGMAKMGITQFLTLTTIGSLIWNTFLIILGKTAGDSWEEMCLLFDKYSHILLIVICIITSIILGYLWIKKVKKENLKEEVA